MKVGLILAASLFSVCTGFSVPKCSNLYTSPSRVGRHSHPRGRRSSVLFSAISSNGELLPGIAAINEANDEISAKLEYLRQTPYFRLYSVDILASCEYMPQELFECYSETCEVYPIDEEDVSIILTLLKTSILVQMKLCSSFLLFIQKGTRRYQINGYG